MSEEKLPTATHGWLAMVHVYPVNDLKEHTTDRCWCNPTEEDGNILIHNSMDKREQFETGERKPS